ncbi:hypothetical protein [Pelolinea submarina]|nr:hypothetical protein [Pelolinea submarina]
MNPEIIAYWFFRLNGCATITNFIIHPDRRGSQHTDVDVLAVRFPHRAELLTSGEPMLDHPVFTSDGRIDILFAEVKHGQCHLNGPWTNPEDENMQRVLYAVGAFDQQQVYEVAQALYQEGIYQNDIYRVRLFAVGERKNNAIIHTAVQLLWDEILVFIFNRFASYQAQKAHHGQWDSIGRQLFELASRHTQEEFIKTVRANMQTHVNSQQLARQNPG